MASLRSHTPTDSLSGTSSFVDWEAEELAAAAEEEEAHHGGGWGRQTWGQGPRERMTASGDGKASSAFNRDDDTSRSSAVDAAPHGPCKAAPTVVGEPERRPPVTRLVEASAPTPESSSSSLDPHFSEPHDDSCEQSFSRTSSLPATMLTDRRLTQQRPTYDNASALDSLDTSNSAPSVEALAGENVSSHGSSSHRKEEQPTERGDSDKVFLRQPPPQEGRAPPPAHGEQHASCDDAATLVASLESGGVRSTDLAANSSGERDYDGDQPLEGPKAYAGSPSSATTARSLHLSSTVRKLMERWRALPPLSATAAASLALLLVVLPVNLVVVDLLLYKRIAAAVVVARQTDEGGASAPQPAGGRSVTLLVAKLLWLMLPHGALFRVYQSKWWQSILRELRGGKDSGCLSADGTLTSSRSAAEVAEGSEDSEETFEAVVQELRRIGLGACEAAVLLLVWAWESLLDHSVVDPYLDFVYCGVEEAILEPVASFVSAAATAVVS